MLKGALGQLLLLLQIPPVPVSKPVTRLGIGLPCLQNWGGSGCFLPSSALVTGTIPSFAWMSAAAWKSEL